MSQSILRLFVNNAINFMILFPLPFSPPSRNLNKQSCKRSSSHGSNLEAFTFFGRLSSFPIQRTTHTITRFEFLQAAWPMPLYFDSTIKPRFCVCTDTKNFTIKVCGRKKSPLLLYFTILIKLQTNF